MNKRFFILFAAALCFALFSCEKSSSSDDSVEPDNGGTVEQGGNSGTVETDDEEIVTYTSLQGKSGKRGVSFNFEQMPDSDFPLLGPAISWDYNWSSSVPSTSVLSYLSEYGVDFCPMIWNANYNADNIRTIKSSIPTAEYILGFNEPNLTDQANMTPSVAAQYWPDVVALAKELNMKLISPAMNYGTLSGYSDPWVWLDEFLDCDGVSLDDIDGIAVHCYMNSLGALKNFIEGFKKYGKPIWLTEFCAYSGASISAQNQIDFMVECFNYLEADEDVARYAWFIPRGTAVANVNNELLTSRTPVELTETGTVFVNMSTLDRSLFYEAGTVIPAEHYSGAASSTHLRVTTDKSGVLDVSDLKSGNYVEYQLNVASAGTYSLELRCTNYSANALTVEVDGGNSYELELENMGKEWQTLVLPVELPAGKTVLRLTGTAPSPVYINWLRYTKN